MAPTRHDIIQFGDFQTPPALAFDIVRLLARLSIAPHTVIEPSCGRGVFLKASAEIFPDAALFGLDINPVYLAEAQAELKRHRAATLRCADFFDTMWQDAIDMLDSPILVLGNPPWVTNATLGRIGSTNLPVKSNKTNLVGLEAITGKSNFDISEAMLLHNLEWITRTPGVIAVLCKKSVARKVLRRAWKDCVAISSARMYSIDALRYFSAAVDACLLLIRTDGGITTSSCDVFDDIAAEQPSYSFGYADGSLISNMDAYFQARHLRSANGPKWRSGIKHDCSKIFEIERHTSGYRNGYGDIVDIEEDLVFPLSKSSDIGGKMVRKYLKYVIVTQNVISQDTRYIQNKFPKTWKYLSDHKNIIDNRGSVIYRGKPPFSMFGIGGYSFAPFKVAISGMYKSLRFKVFGPVGGKPIMFDDTVYFLPFEDRESADAAASALHGNQAQDFLRSMIFWDDKRPVTADLLRRLDLRRLMAGLDITSPELHLPSVPPLPG